MINFNASVLPPPAPETISALADLIALMADPAAATARIGEYKKACEELRAVNDELKATQAGFAPAEAAHKKATDQITSDGLAAVETARKEFDAARITAENALIAREQRLNDLQAKAQDDAKAAAELRADLDRRLALLRTAAA